MNKPIGDPAPPLVMTTPIGDPPRLPKAPSAVPKPTRKTREPCETCRKVRAALVARFLPWMVRRR